MAWQKDYSDKGVAMGQDKNRSIYLFAAVAAVGGIALFCWDFFEAKGTFDGVLTRNAVGESDYTQELTLTSELYEGDYTVEVEAQAMTEEEVRALFALAEEEIDASFLGENEIAESVSVDVVVSDSYVDGQVSASWNFDNYKLITSSGEITNEELEEDTLVTATVTLSCESYEEIYSFCFIVTPMDFSTQEGFLYHLQQEIAEADAEAESLVLPDEIDGTSISWNKKPSYRGLYLIALAAITLVLVPMAQKDEVRRAEKKRKDELLVDYPRILSQISLFLRVGISLPEATARITKRYEERVKKGEERRPGFELIGRMNREIQDGVSETVALEHMAREAGVKEYRKLTLLLSQNLKKGNEHVIMQLEKEDVEAFEMRKAMARRAGEEASTKLLVPMLGMLGVLLVILVVPALMGMNAS